VPESREGTHDLFREALRARLQASQPELLPLLHIRAARFYEAQSEWQEAITHALAAPDYPWKMLVVIVPSLGYL
jgi:LuxR family maltose regulon positive regulatory protein